MLPKHLQCFQEKDFDCINPDLTGLFYFSFLYEVLFLCLLEHLQS